MDEQNQFPDYGLDRVGLCGTDASEPDEWGENVGVIGFGAYVPNYGVINGDQTPIMMEYDEDDEILVPGVGALVRTKMLELSPEDWAHLRMYGVPREGAVALSDDGEFYQYQSDDFAGDDFEGDYLGRRRRRRRGGLFKRLKRRIKKGIRKVHKRVKKVARKLVKKLPGGKYLLKLHDKVKKISMKLVKPLAKMWGKIATKMAPIAALIPGYGPAIAGALYVSGKIAKIATKAGVILDKVTGKPKFKSGKQAKRFKKTLERAAKKQKKKKRGKKRRRRGVRGYDGLGYVPDAYGAEYEMDGYGAEYEMDGYGAEYEMDGMDAAEEQLEAAARVQDRRFSPHVRRERRRARGRIRRMKRQRRRMGRGQRRGASRLLRAGTPAHRAALRGLGFDIEEV